MIETILSNFHLEKLWYIFKKKFALMLIVGVICGVIGGGYAYATDQKTYTAETSFYVCSNPDYVADTSVNLTGADIGTAIKLVQSYMIVLKSDTVMNAVIDELGLNCSPEALAAKISYSGIEDTAIFRVYVNDSNPKVAMDIANAVADIAPGEIARIVKSGGVEVVDYATLPTYATSARSVALFGLLGFAGGFCVVLIIAMLLGLLDTTVRRKYELRLAFNIPLLGDVPNMQDGKNGLKINKIIDKDSPFALKESYNSIRSNILFTGKGEKCPVYAITSADQDEGKTLNSINIAKTMASMGKKVLLVDADMRNSSIGRQLKLRKTTGLSEFLAGIDSKPNFQEIDENLCVITAGKVPPNPAELLASEKMNNLIEGAKQGFDYVFIDFPPVGIVSDALAVSDSVVGYIIVVRAGVSKIAREKIAVENLEKVNADICGFIFNAINIKSEDYAYRKYGYDYKYGSEEKRSN